MADTSDADEERRRERKRLKKLKRKQEQAEQAAAEQAGQPAEWIDDAGMGEDPHPLDVIVELLRGQGADDVTADSYLCHFGLTVAAFSMAHILLEHPRRLNANGSGRDDDAQMHA